MKSITNYFFACFFNQLSLFFVYRMKIMTTSDIKPQKVQTGKRYCNILYYKYYYITTILTESLTIYCLPTH